MPDHDDTTTTTTENEPLKPEETKTDDTGETTEGGDTASTTEAKPADEDKKKVPWFQQRINDMTREKYEKDRIIEAERRQKEILMEENARLKAGGASPADTTTVAPASSEAEIERRANERAANIAIQTRYNERCNEVYHSGKSDFPDFEDALKNLSMVGAVGENANVAFLQTVSEMPEAHKILHHLGNNLDEAARLVSLPPLKMAVEIARIEAGLGKGKPVSSAPAPLKPIDGKGKSERSLHDPKLSMDEFLALRSKQLEQRKKLGR